MFLGLFGHAAYEVSGLIPDIAFIIVDGVSTEEFAVFILERSGSVMLLLGVDITNQRLFLDHADRESPVALLPEKRAQLGALRFQPFTGGGFDLFHEVRDGDGPEKPDCEMDMIRHATDPIRFAMALTHGCGKKSMRIFANAGLKPWVANFFTHSRQEAFISGRLSCEL